MCTVFPLVSVDHIKNKYFKLFYIHSNELLWLWNKQHSESNILNVLNKQLIFDRCSSTSLKIDFNNRMTYNVNKTSANTSNHFVIHLKFGALSIILWQISPNYLLQPWMEYLYFGCIWWIHVKVNQISSNYSCFWLFIGQSQMITWLWCIKHK